MKPNRKKHERPPVKALVLTFAGAGLLLALVIVLLWMRGLWKEQSLIINASEQVEIHAGKMIKAGLIAEFMGLTNGANLAELDLGQKREAILKRIPNLKDIRMIREMPGRIIITTEERTPFARMEISNRTRLTGHVVDAEGIVFARQRDTEGLPVIRESSVEPTAVGGHLTGKSKAALTLLQVSHEAGLMPLKILDVTVSPKRDYLYATLSNGSHLKIAWEGMLDDEKDITPESRATASSDLQLRLQHVSDAIRSNIARPTAPDSLVWNAADDINAVFAEAKAPRNE